MKEEGRENVAISWRNQCSHMFGRRVALVPGTPPENNALARRGIHCVIHC